MRWEVWFSISLRLDPSLSHWVWFLTERLVFWPHPAGTARAPINITLTLAPLMSCHGPSLTKHSLTGLCLLTKRHSHAPLLTAPWHWCTGHNVNRDGSERCRVVSRLQLKPKAAPRYRRSHALISFMERAPFFDRSSDLDRWGKNRG